MKESLKKYHGVFPAFYACYDDAGAVSPDRVERFTDYLIQKGVNGLYVGGSSGECIYQIPGTTQYALSMNLFNRMREHKKVIGIKNSSMPVQDIQKFKAAAGEDEPAIRTISEKIESAIARYCGR